MSEPASPEKPADDKRAKQKDVTEQLRARVLELAEQVEHLALKDPIAYSPDWHRLTNALHLVRRAWELIGEGYPQDAEAVLDLISY